jgi:hypothetical protein
MVPMKTFGPEIEDIVEGWKIFHSDELQIYTTKYAGTLITHR